MKKDYTIAVAGTGYINALNQMNIKYYVTKYYKVFTELKGDFKDFLRKVNVYYKDFYNSCMARRIAKLLLKNQLLNFWILRWGILVIYLIFVLIKERYRSRWCDHRHRFSGFYEYVGINTGVLRCT